jgi:hypothetical protein
MAQVAWRLKIFHDTKRNQGCHPCRAGIPYTSGCWLKTADFDLPTFPFITFKAGKKHSFLFFAVVKNVSFVFFNEKR